MNKTTKIFRALKSAYRYRSITPNPKVVMTLLVKNEEHMLEENLIFHRSMGVDAFIITDNNSTDRTPDIIRKYVDKGWIVESIAEPATDYSQKRWVDRMVQLAITKHHADWIINADADEFWYHPDGFKAVLSATRSNVQVCRSTNVYPREGQPWQEWAETVRVVADLSAYDLSPYSVFVSQGVKVMHRSTGYLQIHTGNHKVTMFPRKKQLSPIRIYHYNVQDKEHFMRKMINGGKQLEQCKGKHVGRHWRYFYALYQQGLLEQEYDRVTGKHRLAQLQADGYMKADCPVPAMLNNLQCE